MPRTIRNIIVGAGRILDVSASSRNIDFLRCRSRVEFYARRTDAEALRQDLTNVGRDMTSALEKAKGRG